MFVGRRADGRRFCGAVGLRPLKRWLYVWRAKEGGRNADGLIPLSDVGIGEQQTLPRNRDSSRKRRRRKAAAISARPCRALQYTTAEFTQLYTTNRRETKLKTSEADSKGPKLERSKTRLSFYYKLILCDTFVLSRVAMQCLADLMTCD